MGHVNILKLFKIWLGYIFGVKNEELKMASPCGSLFGQRGI